MDYVHQAVPKHATESKSLTQGPQTPALYENMEVHPTKIMQDNIIVNGERQQLQQMSVLYGSHMPMRYVMERSILAQTQRIGGYGSSMFGLNHHMDRYDELDFFDILGGDDQTPVLDKEGPHARMEAVYGLSK